MDECNEAKQLLAELKEIGVAIKLQDGKVQFSPQSAVTPELLARMREHKDGLISVLQGVIEVPPKTSLKEPERPTISEVPVKVISEAVDLPREYGGLRRLPYFGLVFGIFIFQGILLGFLIIPAIVNSALDAKSNIRYIAAILLNLFFLPPAFFRLKNLGNNPAWGLLMLFPFFNLFIGIPLLVCPEGYADTKKLDTTGLVITCVMIAFIVGMIGCIILITL